MSSFGRDIGHGLGGGCVLLPCVAFEFQLVFGGRKIGSGGPCHGALVFGVQRNTPLPLNTPHGDSGDLLALPFDPESDFGHHGAKLQCDGFFAARQVQLRGGDTYVIVTLRGRGHLVLQHGSSRTGGIAQRKSAAGRCIGRAGEERQLAGAALRPVLHGIVRPLPVHVFEQLVAHEIRHRIDAPRRVARLISENPDLRTGSRSDERRGELHGVLFRLIGLRIGFGLRNRSRTGIFSRIVASASRSQSQ